MRMNRKRDSWSYDIGKSSHMLLRDTYIIVQLTLISYILSLKLKTNGYINSLIYYFTFFVRCFYTYSSNKYNLFRDRYEIFQPLV